MKAVCEVCFRHCNLEEGQTGICFARENRDGKAVIKNYGEITAIALDPIEKKPLCRFFPGSRIVSVGGYGCNLKCPFCQNVEISYADKKYGIESDFVQKVNREKLFIEKILPEELVKICEEYRKEGNIGIAYTYNEPLVGYEFVLDTARLIHDKGMKNVLVTNGSVELSVLEKLEPYVDAMNVDLKCFNERYYQDVLKGNFEAVKEFICYAAGFCHVELTTLLIPGENDSENEMRELALWVSGIEHKQKKKIPLHISRFFPRSRYSDRQPTDIKKVYQMAEIAREHLEYVYTGNC